MYFLRVFQILVNSITQPALLYENVAVSEVNPILRDMLFSPDHQYIYTLTDKEVRLWGVYYFGFHSGLMCFIWNWGTLQTSGLVRSHGRIPIGWKYNDRKTGPSILGVILFSSFCDIIAFNAEYYSNIKSRICFFSLGVKVWTPTHFYTCLNIENSVKSVTQMCQNRSAQHFSTFFVCAKEKRDASPLLIACMWYSTLRVSPLPTFPHVHMHTHACTAPLVIHHLSEKIEEGPLWSFLMEKKASKPHPPPPSLRRRAWEFLVFFSFHLASSFVFLWPLSCSPHLGLIWVLPVFLSLKGISFITVTPRRPSPPVIRASHRSFKSQPTAYILPFNVRD